MGPWKWEDLPDLATSSWKHRDTCAHVAGNHTCQADWRYTGQLRALSILLAMHRQIGLCYHRYKIILQRLPSGSVQVHDLTCQPGSSKESPFLQLTRPHGTFQNNEPRLRVSICVCMYMRIQLSRTYVFFLLRFLLIPPDHIPPDLTIMNLCDPHEHSLVEWVCTQFAIY